MKKAANPTVPTARTVSLSQHAANYQSQAIAKGKAISLGRQTTAQKAFTLSSAVKLCASAARTRSRALDRI